MSQNQSQFECFEFFESVYDQLKAVIGIAEPIHLRFLGDAWDGQVIVPSPMDHSEVIFESLKYLLPEGYSVELMEGPSLLQDIKLRPGPLFYWSIRVEKIE